MLHRRSPRSFFVFTELLLILLAGSASAARALGGDPTLREARLAELAGDRAGAAGMYAQWLTVHPGAPLTSIVLARYVAREQDLPSLIEMAGKLHESPGGGSADGPVLGRVARILEVAGRAEAARDMYLGAFARGASPSVLESAFLLSLEMNDIGSMSKTLSDLKNTESRRTALLEACLAWQKGDAVPARDALKRMSEDNAEPEIALKALWMLSTIAARAGDSASAGDAQRKLAARFPLSPEYALAAPSPQRAGSRGSARVVLLPGPEAFFAEPPGEPPAAAQAPAQQTSAPRTPAFELAQPDPPPETERQTAAPASAAVPALKLSVQAGSFQMKENADDLVGELTRKGFSPVVRTEGPEGKPLYRVLAGSSLSGDDARSLLEKLHAAGFSGFLVKDE